MRDLIRKILIEESTPILREQQMEYFPIRSDRFNIGYDRKGLGRGVTPKSLDRYTSIHNNDYNGTTHAGIDIFAPKGEEAYSPVTGKIIKLGHHGSAGGEGITISRDDNMHFRLVHMDSLDPNLEVGQTINAGDYFGVVGNSGNARDTHAHIHFSVHGPDEVYRYSNDVDPCPYLEGTIRMGDFEINCDRGSHIHDDEDIITVDDTEDSMSAITQDEMSVILDLIDTNKEEDVKTIEDDDLGYDTERNPIIKVENVTDLPPADTVPNTFVFVGEDIYKKNRKGDKWVLLPKDDSDTFD